MARKGYRRWWGTAGGMAFLLLAFLGYAIVRGMRSDAIVDPTDLNELYKASGDAATQELRAGRKPVGFPVEMEAQNSHTYLDLLVARGYLTPHDRQRLNGFVVANVSVSDPAETALLVSRNYYDAWQAHRPLPAHYLVLLKYGQACAAAGDGVPLRLPPRSPAFLEP